MRRKAFTFIEVMVTVAMVVTVLTLSSVAYRNSSKRIEIIYTAQGLASNARLMQAYAASSKAWNNVPANNIWGLFIDKNANTEYKLWVDTSETKGTYAENANELYKTIKLPKRITIASITCKIGTADPVEINKVAISFTPPDPLVSLVKDNSLSLNPLANNYCDVVEITIKDDFNQSEKIVSLNFFGLVDVER